MVRHVRSAFKFCRKKHAVQMVDEGVFRIGSLSYYRGLEEGIGDWQEGLTHRFIPSAVIVKGDLGSEKILDRINAFSPSDDPFFKLSGRAGQRLAFNNAGITDDVGGSIFVFCASLPDEGRCPPTVEDYDAAVFISDMNGLAEETMMNGVAIEDGRPLQSLFWRTGIGPVTYMKKIVNVLENYPHEPSAFLKSDDPVFVKQREIRFVLLPMVPISVDGMLVSIPEPHRFFKREF